MKIILLNKAKQNINSIFEYIAEDSLKYAIETDSNIRLTIHKLRTFPYIGGYVPELPDKNFRELLYKNYRIIYNVSEESSTVYIHFIVHGKRNFKSFYNSYLKNN